MSDIAPLLFVRQLCLKAPTNHTLFEDISFSVYPGQIWAILGENGAGKTALLNTIVGLTPSAAEAIYIAQHPLAESPKTLATLRAYLPQHPYFPSEQAVFDTVMNARYPYRSFWQMRYSEEDIVIVENALTQFQLHAQLDKEMMALSGGQQQWVALAATWAQDTPLILLDEPITFLDLSRQHRLFCLIQSAAAHGKALLISLQDPNLALQYCTHALCLFKEGDCISGPVAEILTAETLSRLYHFPMKHITHENASYFITDLPRP